MHLADKREYAKFEQEKLKTSYKYESPIYKSPITEVRNPLLESRPNTFIEAHCDDCRPTSVFELK